MFFVYHVIANNVVPQLTHVMDFNIEAFNFVLWGNRDGAVMRALPPHQCGPGLIPGLGVICGLSLLLVLVVGPRGFSPGTPVTPSPQKAKFTNSNSIWRMSPVSALR